jgi:hypothetical protein
MQFAGFLLTFFGFLAGVIGALAQSGKAQIVAALTICAGLLMCIFG